MTDDWCPSSDGRPRRDRIRDRIFLRRFSASPVVETAWDALDAMKAHVDRCPVCNGHGRIPPRPDGLCRLGADLARVVKYRQAQDDAASR